MPMKTATTMQLKNPTESSGDASTDVLRQIARDLLQAVVEAEVSELLSRHEALVDERGRRRLVRHGHLSEREVMTRVGKLLVRVPKVRDRGPCRTVTTELAG